MMTVKVLGICASPRHGNSLFFLNKAMDVTDEMSIPVEKKIYHLSAGKKIQPCNSCYKCWERSGRCVFEDDFEDLQQLWIASDVVIYSVPVYHLSIPGQLKCFIDRLGHSFHGYYSIPSVRHLKVIGILAQGASLYGGQELTIEYLIMHSVLLNSIPVAGDGSESHIGAGAWTGGGLDAKAMEIMKQKEEKDLETALRGAQSVVRRAVEVAAIVKTGAVGLSEILNKDARYRPYLDRVTQKSHN